MTAALQACPVVVPGSVDSWLDAFSKWQSSPAGDADAFYRALAVYLAGPGALYARDLEWVDPADPTRGLQATRVALAVVDSRGKESVNIRTMGDSRACVQQFSEFE